MKTEKPIEKLKIVPLKFWLPIVVVGIGLMLMLVLLVMQLQSYERGLNNYVNHNLHDEILRSQRNIEIIFRRGDITDLDYQLSELGLNPALQRAVLIDDQDKILAATRFEWRQQLARDVLVDYPAEKIALLKREKHELLTLDKSKHQLSALVPIALPLQPGELRASRQGVLLVDYSLHSQSAQLWGVIQRQTIVFSIMLLLAVVIIIIFVQKRVMLPMDALQQSMRNIARGKFGDIPEFEGEGELQDLRSELGSMAFQLSVRTASLAASEARFRQLSEASQEVIVFHDNGIIVEANEMLEQVLGYKESEVIGKPLISFVAPYHQKLTLNRIEKFDKGVWVTDAINAAGEIVPMEVSVNQQKVDGRVLRVITGRDIRDRLQAQEEIRRLSHYDVLTGLANRTYLTKQVALELHEVERLSTRAALAAININGFKSINDSLGMAAGDEVLRLVARRLSALLDKGQILARVEGDTFAVLITQLSGSLDQASAATARIIEGLLAAVNDPFIIQGQELELTAGAGVVMIPNDSKDPAELLREAETAMHQAKSCEDDQVHFFAHALQEAANERLTLRNELRQAIYSNSQLVLHYQPQVKANGQLHGVEVLVRWQHPTKGMIPPLDFIVEAENNGLIVPLGNWVLKEAAETLQRWRQQADKYPWAKDLRMAVNVSPRQFREKDFVTRIEDTISSVGVDAVSFELELTELVVANDLEQTLERMERLSKFGVRFALDDFGTGYSSLSYLKRLPIDTLKIDRSFVMDIDANVYGKAGKRPAVLIDAIVAMAHQLGMEVLAEGVETPAQLEYLRKAGCDYYQGYYFSKPLPDQEFLAKASGQDYLI